MNEWNERKNEWMNEWITSEQVNDWIKEEPNKLKKVGKIDGRRKNYGINKNYYIIIKWAERDGLMDGRINL
jgi:hypothetical protein